MREKEQQRILLMAPQPFFENRGTPINVRAMLETLVASGYLVDLLTFPFGEDIQLEGLTIRRVPKIPGISAVPIGPSLQKIPYSLLLGIFAFFLSLKRRYAVYHGIEEAAFVAGTLGTLFGRPYVFDMDSSMSQQLTDSGLPGGGIGAGVFKFLESFFIPRATAVLTVCEALSKQAKEFSENVSVYQIEDFPSADAGEEVCTDSVEKLKAEIGLKAGQRVLLYAGNFERYQGIDLLVESFAVLPEAYLANTVLLLVGGGKLEGEKVQRFREQVSSLGIAEKVVFTGNRPLEEMPLFSAMADVLLSTRREGENTPLKLYNYMASERPIVATEIYSHTQVLNKENAYLGEPTAEGVAKALTEALQALESGEEHRASNAKHCVETLYSREQFDKRLLAMYSDIVAV